MKNTAILLGHAEDAPEIKSLPNGKTVANFNLLTTETWKYGKTGEEKSSYERHRIAIFNDKIVELVKNYVKKGELLYIEGRIESRSWQDATGQTISKVDIVVRPGRGSIIFMGEKDASPKLI